MFSVENMETRLEEVLPILDSLHLLGGELEPLGGLEDQHNRRTKAKLANLMKKEEEKKHSQSLNTKLFEKKNSPAHQEIV